jgi:two-component system response regulator DevR
VESIRRVARGESLVQKAVTRKVVTELTGTATDSPASNLTTRERQVLELIAEGLTNRQIGDQLDLAEKTVKNYVSGLLAKLGMARRTQAAVYGAGLRPR